MRQARVRQGGSIGALLITPDQDVFYIASTVPHSVLDYLNHKQQKNDAFINQLETLAVAVAHYSFTRLIGVGFPHLLSFVDNVAALSLLVQK